MDRIGRVYWKSFGSFMSGSYTDARSIEPVVFTLTEGQITILPVTVRLTKESPWVDFVPTARDPVLAKLSPLANFGSWKVAP